MFRVRACLNFDGLERSTVSDDLFCNVNYKHILAFISLNTVAHPSYHNSKVVQCYFILELKAPGPGLALCPASNRSAPPLKTGGFFSSARKNS